MWMVLTENLTDDTGRFLGLAGVPQSETVHSEKHPSMYRLESITHIRKRPGHDHRHGVVDVRTPHLLVYIHLLNPTCLYFIFHI